MSTILVDNLTGKTSAGSITVTSEGGAATQSLQQGLAKAWCTFNADSGTPIILDNVNVTSLTDINVGVQTVNFTNSFNNNSYATTASPGKGGNKNAVYDNTQTSSVEITTETATTGSNVDFDHVSIANHGDLA